MVLEILLYLTPGIVACYYYFHMKGEETRAIRFIVFTFLFCYLINLFAQGVILVFSGWSGINESFTTFKEMILYAAASVFAAILLPNILLLINLVWEKMRNAKKKQ